MRDGAVKVLMWNAGLQATKGPAKRNSCYRMKAQVDEESLRSNVALAASVMGLVGRESDPDVVC